MKKVLKFIKNFILIVFLIAYFSVVIGVSTLLIARNDFNFTQFGDNVVVIMDKEYATDKYKENSVVLVKNKKIDSLKEGEEVFVYDVDTNTNDVSIIVEKIGKIGIDGTSSPYIVLNNLGTYYGQDYIAGVAYKTYDDYGKYLSFLEGKWIFFGLLIVPCFFILIYEIYLLIIAIKYDSIPAANTNVGTIQQPVVNQTIINPNVQQQVQNTQPVVDVPLQNLNDSKPIQNVNVQSAQNNSVPVQNVNTQSMQATNSSPTQNVGVKQDNVGIEIVDIGNNNSTLNNNITNGIINEVKK